MIDRFGNSQIPMQLLAALREPLLTENQPFPQVLAEALARLHGIATAIRLRIITMQLDLDAVLLPLISGAMIGPAAPQYSELTDALDSISIEASQKGFDLTGVLL